MFHLIVMSAMERNRSRKVQGVAILWGMVKESLTKMIAFEQHWGKWESWHDFQAKGALIAKALRPAWLACRNRRVMRSGSWSRSYRALEATVRIFGFYVESVREASVGIDKEAKRLDPHRLLLGFSLPTPSPHSPLFWCCFLLFIFQYNFLCLYLSIPWDWLLQDTGWSLIFGVYCLLLIWYQDSAKTHEMDPFLHLGKKKEWLYYKEILK